jgi:threonine aldolase
MDFIDLRSDTVTWPTDRMRQAMAEARVGDDVFGDDPTVKDLEARAARRFRKEAAVFTPSGSMANLMAILAHCGRGERVILGDRAHAFALEGGNPATLGSVQAYPVPVQPDGTLRLEDLEAAISVTDDYHVPLTKLIALETTQAGVGGQPISAAYTARVGALCRRHGLGFHLDGARIFHSAVALGEDVADQAADADTVMVCLSKGLCAPVGSVLVGSATLIERARRIRKALGGGLRQAGILAAAGILALEEMTERLGEDHVNARALAEGLALSSHLRIDLARVTTNMFFAHLGTDAPLDHLELAARLREDGILVMASPARLRFVTHHWIRPEHIPHVVARVHHHLS